ncbi:Copper transport outer membrane protein, MctB [Sanguibacter gelidistatuariae]|uniref:Copper transport outer membrane protein, MctB n=1 Tax=Sanguibacter gelidistatuariae TaxID=1814289 RepID=A0A1G6TTX7_9MICO|nr:copper transporter [Sanguibacter gelidistatuariae]SDD32553.1 Copper transport outer membrane protein, MctB [Sanguibacter gelidistatuariae]
MIDFRYHIVSLISVFLALAVGIILGAGPLKESIGDQLTGQVDALRSDKDALRTELDGAHTALTDTESFVAATAPSLLEGVLPGRRVAIIQLGTIDDAVYDSAAQQILAAGATVSARVQVTDAWTDPAQADTRQSYATSLTEYLDNPAAAEGFDTTLAQVLVNSLADADPANPDVFSSDAGLVRLILVDGKLIEVLTDPQAPADAFVILTPKQAESGAEKTAEATAIAAAAEIEVKLVVAAQAGSEGAVVAGTAPVEGDLISVIRADSALASTLTTVTDLSSITGAVNVPLALAARIGGQVGQFGFGAGATAPAPPAVALEPITRVPSGGDVAPDAGGAEPPAEGDAG